MNLFEGSLPDRLASEYVLGTLTGAARRRFETLMAAHPRLRDAVADWEAHLLPMALSAPPIAPGDAVWTRLRARVAEDAAARQMPASRATQPLAGQVRQGRQLRLWRAYGALATLLAMLLAFLLRLAPAEAPLIVVLHATKGSELLVAGVSADRQRVSIRPLQKVSLTQAQSLELWALHKQGAPSSLGLISADGLTAVRKQTLPRDTTGLAVTLEPAGGSPHGVATGPILFVGDLTL